LVQRSGEHSERAECGRWEHDPSRLSVLRGLDPALAIERTADRRPPVRNVNVAPPEGGKLTGSNAAGVSSEQDERSGLFP
jgi:hypothetical protein